MGDKVSSIEELDDSAWFSERDIPRNDPDLIAVIEHLGLEASGRCGNIQITEIPDGTAWEIEEYDGREWVSEVHRTW